MFRLHGTFGCVKLNKDRLKKDAVYCARNCARHPEHGSKRVRTEVSKDVSIDLTGRHIIQRYIWAILYQLVRLNDYRILPVEAEASSYVQIVPAVPS